MDATGPMAVVHVLKGTFQGNCTTAAACIVMHTVAYSALLDRTLVRALGPPEAIALPYFARSQSAVVLTHSCDNVEQLRVHLAADARSPCE